ncbi:MAG TPA: PTS sugar transporter subunit IIB [Thermoflexia bacterium]|nr:PTS sugar transporter subunit IIB [Thermoflexia bacterium]
MEEKRVLIACGTSIATATVVAEKVKEIAQKAGIPVRVAQCKAAEVRGRTSTFDPHIIVATTPVPKDLGIPVFNGVPFLSGVGMEALEAQIVEALKKAE